MPATLFGSRFVGMRKPAWHNLGTVLQDQVTAAEAIKLGKIDYEYVSVPMGYQIPGGDFIQADDRKIVLRQPTQDDPEWRRMGVVAPNYTFLQNQQLAEGLDKIAEKTGWRFETAGALGNGETVFLTLDAGERDIKGDPYQQYFIVSDGKANGRSLQVSVAPVRVVCQNTLSMADSAATRMVKLPHTPNVEKNYSFWLDIVSSMEKARERAFDQLEQMAGTQISKSQAADVFQAAFPDPEPNQAMAYLADHPDLSLLSQETVNELQRGKDKYDAQVEWIQEHRQGCETLYERFNDGDEQGGKMPEQVRAKLSGTAYAALQAVTEVVDWTGRGSAAKSATAIMFGYKAQIKRRAWKASMALSMGELVEIVTAPVGEEVLVEA